MLWQKKKKKASHDVRRGNDATWVSVLSCQIFIFTKVAIGTCFLTLCHTFEVCRPKGNGTKSNTCHASCPGMPLHLAAMHSPLLSCHKWCKTKN